MTDTTWMRVSDVAHEMNISCGCARSRMRQMEGCINIGTSEHQMLMVPRWSYEQWLRDKALAPADQQRIQRRTWK